MIWIRVASLVFAIIATTLLAIEVWQYNPALGLGVFCLGGSAVLAITNLILKGESK